MKQKSELASFRCRLYRQVAPLALICLVIVALVRTYILQGCLPFMHPAFRGLFNPRQTTKFPTRAAIKFTFRYQNKNQAH
jgi:hypothetical protein